MNYPNNYIKQPNHIFFCDIETTGLDHWRNEILTLSISLFNYESLTMIDELELKFKPQNLEYWQQEAENIHKISVAEAMQFPSKQQSTNALIEFISSVGKFNVFCCHALKFKNHFDWLFVKTHLCKANWGFEVYNHINKIESTIDFYKHAVKEQKISLDNFKLNTICETLNIPLNHHDAKADRVACQEIYKIARAL